MKYIKSYLGFLAILSLSVFNGGFAQVSHGGQPYSFTHQLETPIAVMPDASALIRLNFDEGKDCSGLEFARFLPLNISLTSDDWQINNLPNGDRIYQLSIKSKGALGIGVYFNNLFIPEGGELFIYSPDHQQYIGSFNHLNNKENKILATEFLYGEEVIIEYFEPKNKVGQSHFTVNEILHAYRGVREVDEEKGYGGSGDCEVNVNCPEGNGKKDQRDAVVRILIKKGSAGLWCTGSLINNTSEDRTPYIITADHCGKASSDEDMEQWIFYFHYQSLTCEFPDEEPEHQSVEGCEKIAASSNADILGSDFFLVKITQDIPLDYNPFFIGWNRDGLGSNSGYTIHHPDGDIKKISIYEEPLVSASYSSSGITNAYWQVVWAETESGHGVTEGGSSGSPIFDQNGYLIGTLTGGQAACSNLTGPDFYGKISVHWEDNGTADDEQLMPWLDPLNSGIEKMSGTYLGLDEKDLIQTDLFSLFPNPAQESVTLYFKEDYRDLSIQLYDIKGSLVNETMQNGNSQVIPTDHLMNGVYFIKATNSKSSQTIRFLKN
ncbi:MULTISPECIES: T9SS type A sorting domain-containing protein [unclassified Lentimicrobium]|uniref:T9SS type A sorting domain-containing protein n=1 Tax=unclassified Lentimicrobium TaxID=2677434 RepID=UPI001554ACA3|nr:MULTISPECIES: T9SS type A sorting domain-containing protein [unclassified Lentimicrobium]NPD47707.1 T9SS type A sorting domain-containing protein [Lentimicrobium sp. S6]NPD83891.1 T9SS type A sorting domain-containing protein [Lentimicrobium sp. L6]